MVMVPALFNIKGLVTSLPSAASSPLFLSEVLAFSLLPSVLAVVSASLPSLPKAPTSTPSEPLPCSFASALPTSTFPSLVPSASSLLLSSLLLSSLSVPSASSLLLSSLSSPSASTFRASPSMPFFASSPSTSAFRASPSPLLSASSAPSPLPLPSLSEEFSEGICPSSLAASSEASEFSITEVASLIVVTSALFVKAVVASSFFAALFEHDVLNIMTDNNKSIFLFFIQPPAFYK